MNVQVHHMSIMRNHSVSASEGAAFCSVIYTRVWVHLRYLRAKKELLFPEKEASVSASEGAAFCSVVYTRVWVHLRYLSAKKKLLFPQKGAYLFTVSPAIISHIISIWCQSFNCCIIPDNSANQHVAMEWCTKCTTNSPFPIFTPDSLHSSPNSKLMGMWKVIQSLP